MADGKGKKGRDFYEILGIERTANQGQIKSAYRRLAMKYHPDKNPGNEEASEKFKEVSTAYAVLSDPNKKRQYDIHGEEGSVADLGSINVEDLGTVGRLFGALISKAGIPVPTEITQKVLTGAQHLGKGLTDVPGFDVPKVEDLLWGQTVTGTVERQAAHFFRITVTEADLKNGVIIRCSSTGKDKFKIVFFDQEGHVTMVEESQQSKRASEANLYVVPYGRYHLMETMPLSMMKHLEEDVPPVFMILDTYDKDIKNLLPGTHLFCVYGDNWFQSVRYTLRCLVAVHPEADCVKTIQTTEEKLALKKKELEQFQTEFCEVKKKYDAAKERLENDVKEITELVQSREGAYTEYADESALKYSHVPSASRNTTNSAPGANIPLIGGITGGIGKLFG
ncbi:chaperone protein dnaJ 15 isoform X2 [Eurytemora carolleeae]|uniref:chaperone protein dnaJ 15 isoform X2 n=1 Tax=Eurytemora carolleeae TaxID=1294199 RepID=UPI000C760C9E|nr:chaperone protein dnaJ 15 isoform X2 [Eurytemora carolleeae]|eukprot:XP_023337500.1 chaperone protein dnaJ 15-like isoform X2 [Eurytemora affinis]